MQKDFKIGLMVGVLLVIGATVWLCTLPRFGTQARVLREQQEAKAPERPVQPAPRSIIKPDVALQPSRQEEKPVINQEPVKPVVETVTARVHIVQRGDTLSGISEKYYGSAGKWQKIFAANRMVLENPDKLVPGTRLVIPE